jgi:hypothetical protein
MAFFALLSGQDNRTRTEVEQEILAIDRVMTNFFQVSSALKAMGKLNGMDGKGRSVVSANFCVEPEVSEIHKGRALSKIPVSLKDTQACKAANSRGASFHVEKGELIWRSNAFFTKVRQACVAAVGVRGRVTLADVKCATSGILAAQMGAGMLKQPAPGSK